MITFKFEDFENMYDFLLNTPEINNWETIVCRLSASNGVELNITTVVLDGLKSRKYADFKSIKKTIEQFMKQNIQLNINLEIKLKFPDQLRHAMDLKDNFDSFYLNFYSSNQLNYFSISFLENTKDFDSSPLKSFTVYITNIFNGWKNKNNLA